MSNKIVKILRRDNPNSNSYWESFNINYRPNMNVITILQDIQKNPVTVEGKKTTPVIWDCNCLEEVCGACSMIINGKAQQACTALVDQLSMPIVIRPFTTFPIVRDLKVDRSIMFENLKKIKAWMPLDGTYDLGPGPRIPAKVQEFRYELSRCMTCGCCLEVCPQVNNRSSFVGPALLSQVVFFNLHPTGDMNIEERLETVAGTGGVTDCGNSQNCVRICPKQIPLITSIAKLNRQMTSKILFGALNR